jgi:cytoskeletal protein CcmA (bactofilin family)
MLKAILLTVFALGFMPSVSSADTVLRTGTDITVAQEQSIEGNYYVSTFFTETTMSGVVAGDMLAFGGEVTMNGEVKKDLLIVGGSVQIYGVTGEDVRVLGGDVTIAGKIAGDVLVLGGTLHVLPTAEIGGDIFFFGGTADINGAVAGSVYGKAEQFTVNGPIAKNIDVSASLGLTLGARAVVAGDVRYTSSLQLIRDTNATVSGTVVQNTKSPETTHDKARDIGIPFLVLLFTTLALYLIFKREVETLVVQVTTAFGVSGFVGLGVIVFGPIISVLLMVTMLGFLLGLMSMFVVLALLVAGTAFASLVVGGLLSLLIVKRVEVSLLWAVLGSVFLYASLFIPVLGAVVYLTITIVTIGALTILLYKSIS